jgi:hypothetical protein
VNAPESAQIGRPNLKATRRNVDALSKVRQNWHVYFRNGAFTFARYEIMKIKHRFRVWGSPEAVTDGWLALSVYE